MVEFSFKIAKNKIQMKKIAAIFAHPDDEILGCGATLSKYSQSGSDVNVLLLSNGYSSRDRNNFSKDEFDKQISKSLKKIGCSSIIKCDFPDNKMDSVPLLEIVKKIENFIFRFNPDAIFTHFFGDLNIDHRIVYNAVLTAARPHKFKGKIFSAEINSSTEWNYSNNFFRPNIYESVEGYINNKIEAMKLHKNELMKWPHPRSLEGIKNLSKLRGQEVGLNYAEAFMLIRGIVKE